MTIKESRAGDIAPSDGGDNAQSVKTVRAACGMTQQAFADYFGLSKRAVESWEGGQRQCPDYLLNLMIYKLKNEGLLPA